MLDVRLTADQRAALEQVSRQAVGRVALRAPMVLASDRGHDVPQIAAIHGCGQDVVRTWLHRDQERELAGLHDVPRSGRPPTGRLARQIVGPQAGQSPRCAGLVQSCWTVALLAAFLAARFGLLLAAATVRRPLKAAGWRWRRPRLAPASVLPHKGAPAAAGKTAAIAAALQRARRGWCHLLFLDGCDLHLPPVLRACWQQGPRLRGPTPSARSCWSWTPCGRTTPRWCAPGWRPIRGSPSCGCPRTPPTTPTPSSASGGG